MNDKERDKMRCNYRAMVLRLLSQILIKVHAGKEWGASEEKVKSLSLDAEDLARQYEEIGA